MTDLQALMIRHEGKRDTPYLDCCGHPWRTCTCAVKGNLTIGVGRNLDAVPLSEAEIIMLLNADLCTAIRTARRLCSIYDALTPPRQQVLVSMAFNLGQSKLERFVRFWDAIHREHWDDAADEMLNSKWARQVGRRATELATMMRTG